MKDYDVRILIWAIEDEVKKGFKINPDDQEKLNELRGKHKLSPGDIDKLNKIYARSVGGGMHKQRQKI